MSDDDIIEYTVPEGVSNVRVDKLLAENFAEWSRALLQKVFDEGGVSLNGKRIKKNLKVNAGDVVFLTRPVLPPTEVKAVEIPLDILYEDEFLVCVNKTSGMVTHPGSGTGEDTLVHALLHHTGGNLSMAGGEERPGVVHRLDKDTSGAIVFAKSDEAYFRLVESFSNRRVRKEYLALALNAPRLESGSIKKPIERNKVNRTKMCVSEQGRAAHTDWKVEERFGQFYTLLHCRIHTGRTHQIRVHLSDMGHPIVGDDTYGYRAPQNDWVVPTRVFLHSRFLQLAHPIVEDKVIELKAPLPVEFEQALETLRMHLRGDSKT